MEKWIRIVELPLEPEGDQLFDDMTNSRHVAFGGVNKDTKKTRRLPKLPVEAKKKKNVNGLSGSRGMERAKEPKIARSCL
ncbi:hypothetical protein F442_07736 [Phytophthora nicotianae P10297]|uniref:Uncharacterized protein n=1 Tax=Phytophthora nicotianae P10297 TaxID=1317064 RepID=W2ZG35_PHYNI|nr:hypothetical protein F442_07736 [Phytophthora nicotianae P10297]